MKTIIKLVLKTQKKMCFISYSSQFVQIMQISNYTLAKSNIPKYL